MFYFYDIFVIKNGMLWVQWSTKLVIGCFRLQNWHCGGVLPVCQRSWPHLHHALQVRQASRDTVQVRDTGGSSVWADTRAPHEEYRRWHRTSYCKPLHLEMWIYFIFFPDVMFHQKAFMQMYLAVTQFNSLFISFTSTEKQATLFVHLCIVCCLSAFSLQFYPLMS